MAKQDGGIGPALASATCTLLGSAPAAGLAQDARSWEVDTALMYYGESDERVQDASLGIAARRDFDDDRLLDLNLTVDTLTGASPSGAVAQSSAQTFTSPSGNATYSTPAGEIPLDDTFLDTRFALGAGWTQPFARLYEASAGISFSTEYDYTHLGANVGLTRDFNRRNTSVSLALAYAADDVDPVGGTPLPLSTMLEVGDLSNRRGKESKDVIDVVLGVTQVVSRTTIVRFNYSFSTASGYLNDPYKFLSVVDAVTGDTLVHPLAPGAEGPTGIYRFESRPDSRTKHAAYGEVKHYLGGKVLDVAYRFMTDDWGIDSHTLETRLRWPVGAASYLEPHVRYYTQTAADFYRMSLDSGQTLPRFASADYRLGEFDAVTVGLKLGHETRSGNEWNVRFEYYRQAGDVPAGQLIGNQLARPQLPDLDAVIVQASYRFRL